MALNGSYVAQHLAAVQAPVITLRRPLVSLTGLLRSRLWLAGGVVGISGWLLHVGALSRAPLSLVQAFSAGGLALVVPVAARLTGRPLSSGARRGTLLMAVALAALAVGARPTAPTGSTAQSVLTFALVVATMVMVLLATRRGAHALGAAAGALYGIGDIATKAATTAAHAGWLTSGVAPWAVMLASTSVLAFFCFQRGLQLGTAVAVIALMTAGTNVVAVLGGVIAFGEPIGASPPVVALHAAALIAIVVAGWWLAQAQAAMIDGSSSAASADAANRRGTGHPRVVGP
ncbi:MAG: hypothetical protein ACXVV5_22605 [Solirubrobacteraceae bacterium]